MTYPPCLLNPHRQSPYSLVDQGLILSCRSPAGSVDLSVDLLSSSSRHSSYSLSIAPRPAGVHPIPVVLILNRDMSSSSGSSSKALNGLVPSVPATFHSAAPLNDSGSQRRPGGSGSFGAGLTSRNALSARKNQSRKGQHKRQRPPRLLDDDEYFETVCGSFALELVFFVR